MPRCRRRHPRPVGGRQAPSTSPGAPPAPVLTIRSPLLRRRTTATNVAPISAAPDGAAAITAAPTNEPGRQVRPPCPGADDGRLCRLTRPRPRCHGSYRRRVRIDPTRQPTPRREPNWTRRRHRQHQTCRNPVCVGQGLREIVPPAYLAARWTPSLSLSPTLSWIPLPPTSPVPPPPPPPVPTSKPPIRQAGPALQAERDLGGLAPAGATRATAPPNRLSSRPGGVRKRGGRARPRPTLPPSRLR